MSAIAIGPAIWAAPGSSQVSANVAYSVGPGAANYIQNAMQNPYSTCQVETKTLGAGDNVITIPANGLGGGVLIALPAGNANLVKLKGAAGDTGIFLNKLGWAVITFDATQAATFILNAAGSTPGVTLYWF